MSVTGAKIDYEHQSLTYSCHGKAKPEVRRFGLNNLDPGGGIITTLPRVIIGARCKQDLSIPLEMFPSVRETRCPGLSVFSRLGG